MSAPPALARPVCVWLSLCCAVRSVRARALVSVGLCRRARACVVACAVRLASLIDDVPRMVPRETRSSSDSAEPEVRRLETAQFPVWFQLVVSPSREWWLVRRPRRAAR